MIKSDPIIAVKDVEKTSKWYQSLLGCKSIHGGSEFDILVDEHDEVIICLHKWGEHQHPTMMNQKIMPGNGLLLYFRTNQLETIRKNAEYVGSKLEEEIHINPNTRKKEFSLRDPDGYYLTITEYHNYEG
ncbi:MAG: glyoxalase [Cytophagales bacterium]|nr:glyoxalase [Cytophagales bacterium]